MSKRNVSSRRARGQGGFTIVEVIVSMGVMVLGVMAIVAMQSHTVAVNSLARQMSTANQIAQTWIERLKEDAHTWTQPGDPNGVPTPIMVLGQTTWLQQVNAAPGLFQPFPMLPSSSSTFDFQGNEIFANQPGAAFFCASFKTQWVYVGRAIRADVRVFWPRERSAAVPACIDTDAPLNPGGNLVSRFHIVYLSTVITQTPLIR